VLQAGETKEGLEAQYVRWRELRKMQEENDKKAAEEKRKAEYYSVDGVVPRL
jgi:hypothetical protein